jgi:hypothetical protein
VTGTEECHGLRSLHEELQDHPDHEEEDLVFKNSFVLLGDLRDLGVLRD